MDADQHEPDRLPDRVIRVSDDDRERVIDRLQAATADGRIDLGEFEDRARQVYAARFEADLVPITADLPAVSSALEMDRTRKRERRWFFQLMGGADRTGNWDPRDETITVSIMGGQMLDLTQVAATRVSITAFTLMAGTDIIVPDGAVVELSGLIVMGATENAAGERGSSPMRVRVRSIGAMGACTVRNLTAKERAKRGL